MNIDTSELVDDSYKQPSVEELSPGQVLWFGEWLETSDRTVTEREINAPVIWCATIKEIEQTSFQKGFMSHGKLLPDIKQYVVRFEEGGRDMSFYVGEKEYLNPQFYLDKDLLLAELRQEKQENVEEAEERLRQAERDLERYRAWDAADIPVVSKAAVEAGFRWATVLKKQAEIEATGE